MMSLSEPFNFEHAQSVIKCDHCGGVDDVKHYCLICKETICSSCKTVHNKARATKEHQVVFRGERFTKEDNSTFCKKHPDQLTTLHCDTCNFPVCTKCIAKTHKGHTFSEISKIIENFRRDIKDSKKKMETRMKQVNSLILKGEKNWKDYEGMFKSIESSISRDAAALHSIVDKITNKRKDELNKMRHEDRSVWEAVKGRLDEEKTKISNSLAQHDTCLSSTTTSDMMKLLEESEVHRGRLLHTVKIVPLSYKPCSRTAIEGIGEIIRQTKVTPMVPKRKLYLIEAVVISSFSSTLKGYPSICYAGKGQILLGAVESRDVHILNREGQFVDRRENVLPAKCWSLAVNQSRDVLVSPKERNCSIDILKGQRNLRTLIDTSPYLTEFVTVTEKQEILVCMSKTVNLKSKGQVILYDEKGLYKKQIGSDDLYEDPIQALQLQDGGFCISDFGKQQLVMLHEDNNIRRIIQNPLGRNNFCPRGIWIDQAGNILATDKMNHSVYVIGKDWAVRELLGKAEGIIMPRCLCVDDENNLWIAQDNGQIKVLKYLEEQLL